MGVITTELKIKTNSAQKGLNAIISRMNTITDLANKMNKRVNMNGASFTHVEKQVNIVTKNIERQRKTQESVTKEIAKSSSRMDDLRRRVSLAKTGFNDTSRAASNLSTKLHRLANTYLGVMGAKAALNTADTFTNANNKFNSLGLNSKEVIDKIYQSSLASRSGFADNISGVSKMMTNAGQAFNNDVDAAIRFNEIMQKSYVLGGASAAEQASSIYQLVQALGSGTLQGDELRSVREGAPMAYKAIEQFAQGVYNTTDSLKEIASQGKITSGMVVAAMMDAAQGIDEAFEQCDMTFGQLWTNFKTQATRAFQPVLERIREFMNSDKFEDFVNNVVNALFVMANAVMWVFEQFVNLFNWIGDNWSSISFILYGIVTALISVKTALLIVRAASFVSIHPIITLLGLFAGALVWVLTTAETVAQGLSDFFQLVALVLIGVIGAVAIASQIATTSMTHGWLVTALAAHAANLPLLIMIAILAVLAAAFFAFTEAFVGTLFAVVSVVGNIIGIALGLFVKLIGTLFSVIGTLANFIGNVFTDPIASVVYLFQGLADTVLSILETIARGIDFIFGSNLAGTISGWRKGLKGAADSLANKYGNGTYQQHIEIQKVLDDASNMAQGLTSGSTSQAWRNGWNTGAGIKNGINNVGNLFNAGSIPNGVGSGANLLDTFGGAGAGGGFSPEDYLKDIGNNTGGTAGNTKKMADAMDLMSDELEYLRDVAEQEIVNRYTGVTFNVGGITTEYNGEQSLDGIVTIIDAQLREALMVSAEGVHA